MPERKTVVICDLCEGDPKCVKWCPEEALELSSKDIIAQKARIDAVVKLTKAALEAKT